MKQKGFIKVYTGGMCADKSLCGLQEYSHAVIRGDHIHVFVPYFSKDGNYLKSRFAPAHINGNAQQGEAVYPNFVPAIPIATGSDMYKITKEILDKKSPSSFTQIIDEGQFIPLLKDYIQWAKSQGVYVVVLQLNKDFTGAPFPILDQTTTADIANIADLVEYKSAVCTYKENPDSKICGEPASLTQRFEDLDKTTPSPFNAGTIKVDPGYYAPRCQEHHIVPGKDKNIEEKLFTFGRKVELVSNGLDKPKAIELLLTGNFKID